MENFVVSARKYRPQEFDTVVGQSHITDTLEHAIEENQLAQALLFCGPRGVGKTTCARILARKINEQRNEATRLFKQADSAPMERMGGAFNNQQQLRAQAEGKLEQANMLAKNAQQDFGDMLEVGFGKDADPNSRREWAYAKPKAPKAMEESDALAIQAGNNRRFADPNGLNQSLSVTPEAKARFDHQRKIEGIQQSSYPGLDPVARFGSRVWQGISGESAADMAEAYPPVIPGEEDINRIAQSGVKGAGQLVQVALRRFPMLSPSLI